MSKFLSFFEDGSLMAHGLLQETQAGQNEQLAMLKPDDFSTGIAIMSQDGHDYKLKYSEHNDFSFEQDVVARCDASLYYQMQQQDVGGACSGWCGKSCGLRM